MLSVLILSVLVSLGVSALCSLMEAALYAVPIGHVKHLSESGSRVGAILQRFKDDVGRPISAILILNTVSHTAGAAVAGAAAAELFGNEGMVIFSLIFTLLILYLSEIVPKVVGVVYCKRVAAIMAYPLSYLVLILAPLISVSQKIAEFIKPKEGAPQVSHQEMLSMADIGTEEGSLDLLEGSVIKNVIGLDQVLVRDVLTPRVVVFRKLETTKLSEISDELPEWNFSRVPIYAEDDSDHLTGYVIQRDIYRELLQGNLDLELRELARPIHTVPELMRVDLLMLEFFEKKEHICAVVDEHGGLAGLITLEDVIEEIVGREIVDEYDTISDLRTFAKILRVARSRKVKREE